MKDQRWSGAHRRGAQRAQGAFELVETRVGRALPLQLLRLVAVDQRLTQLHEAHELQETTEE
jgi:hypothetical protein